jgi:2-amino-4-hydroxy-6-hydroxymethyldihydropteridine diphosphokinase
MNKAYLLTGGNTGDRLSYLEVAIRELELQCGKVSKESPIYETAAWGNTDQQAFLNQALLLETKLSAEALMTTILGIEEKMGRIRTTKYGPRTIDIDILLFNKDLFDSDHIKIPHPELAKRRFALQPLADIAASYKHPVLHKTVRQLLKECPDPLAVKKIN